jgi:flagellar basal-body rod protein FlgG
MLEGLHAAAAGMAAQQARMDALGEDVANVSTTGYKHQRVAFRELVYVAAGQAAGPRVATGAGAATELAGRGLAQGPLQQTGRSLDVAIEGSGYLQVRRPDGSIGLTRAGALQVDSTGRLATATGAPLAPPIRVPGGTAESELAIAADGTVTAAGRRIGTIALVDVAAPDQLAAAGDTTFVATAGSGPVRPATGSRLAQGTLEASNVEVSDTMVDMIDAQRAYTLASRAVQIQDQMLDVANGVKR